MCNKILMKKRFFGEKTVVGVVVSVLSTLANTSSAGTGSNPTIGIQSSIVAVNQGRPLKKDSSGSVK
jgi:hypothetical protein